MIKEIKKIFIGVFVLNSAFFTTGCATKTITDSRSSSTKIKLKKESSKTKSQKSSSQKRGSQKTISSSSSSSSPEVRTSSATDNNTASSSSTSTSSPNNQASAKPAPKTDVWNAERNQRLATFMHSWQSSMGQTYVGTYDGQIPDHYGFQFPEAITSGDLKGKVLLNNQAVDLQWYSNDNQGAEYRVVAAATKEPRNMSMITYLFVLHHSHPEVYYTKTTNGGILYLFKTDNVQLQEGFASIMNQGA